MYLGLSPAQRHQLLTLLCDELRAACDMAMEYGRQPAALADLLDERGARLADAAGGDSSKPVAASTAVVDDAEDVDHGG